MKIFITGGSGFLGQYLNLELSKNHEILTQYNKQVGNSTQFNSVQISITDFSKLEEIFQNFRPDIVIHTASISNAEKVDQIEKSLVYDVNVNSTKKIAELCSMHDSKLIYLSTDLVYAGYRGSMLKEDAKLNPISFYSETKLMGEIKIQETFDNYIILRMALLYGFGLYHSMNHFQFAYKDLKNGKEVKLFTDQYRTPLEVTDAARMISELIVQNIKSEIINFGGGERLSRYELMEILCEEAEFYKHLLIRTTMDEIGLTYKVHDVSMNSDKMNAFGIKSLGVRNSMKKILL